MSFCQIQNYFFVTKKGMDPIGPAMRIDDITRDGVDGQAYRQKAKRAPVVMWETEVDTNAPTLLFEAYQALQGTLQTVYGDDLQPFSNVAILDVQRVHVKRVLNPVGGVTPGGIWVLKAHWTMQGTNLLGP